MSISLITLTTGENFIVSCNVENSFYWEKTLQCNPDMIWTPLMMHLCYEYISYANLRIMEPFRWRTNCFKIICCEASQICENRRGNQSVVSMFFIFAFAMFLRHDFQEEEPQANPDSKAEHHESPLRTYKRKKNKAW